MLRTEITTPIDSKNDPIEKAKKQLHIKNEDIENVRIVHRALDARTGRTPRYLYQIDFELRNEEEILKRHKKEVRRVEKYIYKVPECGEKTLTHRPIVIGFGPAGMAAALLLAKKGYKPLVLERGPAIEERQKAVDNYWKTGVLDPEKNVQFGEGGAGAFSDGKLTTRIKDPRVPMILEALVEAGADPSITWLNHPHVGTDNFCKIDVQVRKDIERLGGEVRFNACVTDFHILNNKLTAITVHDETIECEQVILAIGHSARDTFETLARRNVPMEPKPFAVGFRIEHLQSFIDDRQYRAIPDHSSLPASEYHLSHTSTLSKGVYSFCMCPGGYVVASASEKDTVVTNGMSYSTRSGTNANSALVVQVDAKDTGEGLMAGVQFQRNMEKMAFAMGGPKAPAQLVANYLDPTQPNVLSAVTPTYPLGVHLTDLHPLMNPAMNQSMEEMLKHTEKIFPGFTTGGALFTGVETRTSSPIRILRDYKTLRSLIEGLYPCGEGAGFAGGIVSSAIDGVKCAEQIIQQYKPFE